jgi:hypothetical protein
MIRAAAGLALWTLASACGQELSGTGEGAAEGVRAQPGLLASGHDARTTVAHRGVRRIEFARVRGPGGWYREEILTDGRGHYAIEPLDSGEFDAFEWEEFALFQRAREGFVFRYRDVLVREERLFERNWRTTRLAEPEVVAGRTCERVRLERTVPSTYAIELAIDPETGLVLASREFDSGGTRVASMTYESLDLDPELDGVSWHEPANAEQALDPRQPLERVVDVPVLVPRLLPNGYGELERSTLDAGGKRWLKLVYTNGIEPLFFLQVVRDDGPGFARAADVSGPEASSVIVFDLCGTTAVQGRVDGVEVLVVGKTAEAELLDLLESALP